MMNIPGWLLIAAYIYGAVVGLWLGWFIWRDPKLKYKEEDE
jgi:hypothetical protein